MYNRAREMYASWIVDDDEEMKRIELKLDIALGITSLVMIVDFEREMNPEKQGSVYDLKFSDKWEASSPNNYCR